MTLYQPESGYCYNSDSLFLHDFINSFSPKGRVLDVGAGCGIVGLLVARDNKKVILEAVEKQEYFVKYARKNAILNSISYKLYETDFVKLEVEEKYDYIVSNPPFYPEGARKSADEMLIQARYNTALPMGAFFKKVSQLLKPQAHFIFCYDATQFGLICNELEKVKMRVIDVKFIHSKEDKPASLVLVHARNSSKSMMRVLAPIFNFIGNKYSKEAEIIFKNANTESIKCQL